jgi:hypothetical protein
LSHGPKKQKKNEIIKSPNLFCINLQQILYYFSYIFGLNRRGNRFFEVIGAEVQLRKLKANRPTNLFLFYSVHVIFTR